MGFNSTEEQTSGPRGQDSMWRNEKYETVPLDEKGIDEDNSKGTRDSLYPQTTVSHNNRQTFLCTHFVHFITSPSSVFPSFSYSVICKANYGQIFGHLNASVYTFVRNRQYVIVKLRRLNYINSHICNVILLFMQDKYSS